MDLIFWEGYAMKSNFKYFTIIFINFTVFAQVQASHQEPQTDQIIASKDNFTRSAPAMPVVLPTNQPPSNTRYYLFPSYYPPLMPLLSEPFADEHASAQAASQDRKPKGKVIASRDPLAFTTSIDPSLPIVEILNQPEPQETDQQSKLKRSLSLKKIKKSLDQASASISLNRLRPPLTVSKVESVTSCNSKNNSATSNQPPIVNNELHITITRTQLCIIECCCIFAGAGLGAYKATQLFHTTTYPRQTDSEFAPLRRSGLPTDVVGAAFWSFGQLSNVASSGITLVLAGFVLHKVKGWIDTIYTSDTDRRIDKKLDPIVKNIEKLATYVDETTQPLAKSHETLYATTRDIAQEQERLTNIMQETIKMIEDIVQEDQRKDPNNQKSQAMVIQAAQLTQDITQATDQVQKITERLPEQTQVPTTSNPITKKEKPIGCCGCPQQ